MNDKQNNQNQEQGQGYQPHPYYYYPQASHAYYPYQQQRQQQMPQQQQQQASADPEANMLPIQRSYIENILRLNRGKQATIYMTFEGQSEPTVFTGIIEAAGRDHIIISDPQTGKRYLLLMIYLDYVSFDEELNYNYPFDGTNLLSNYPPR